MNQHGQLNFFWLRVYDLLSDALDDFLDLWAIGNLFGKTRDIHMEFTRRTDVLQINIDGLDHTLISARMDIRIKEEFYKLRFEVEGEMPHPMEDVNMDDAAHDDGDGSDLGNERGNGADDRDSKRSKSGADEQTNEGGKTAEPLPPTMNPM